jgi:exodeoxyribonuclease V gamma subunit
MGEGVFPGVDARDPLDLRGHRRRPGDLRRPEQDRYLFLESLLAARERLVLSYVDRDPVTGEELQPSPLVLDLRDILRPALGGDGWRALEVRHPAHRHDLAYFPDLVPGGAALAACHDPAARAEAEALWIGADLRRAAGTSRLEGPLETWGLSDRARTSLEARVHACGRLSRARGAFPGAGPPDGPDRTWGPGPLRIRAGALRKWLECQIQGGAQLRLGLRGEDDYDPAEVAEEPFRTGFLDRRGAVREALWDVLATGRPAGEVCRELLAGLREAAKAPAGCLAEGELAAAAAQVEGWEALLPPGTVPWAWLFGPERRRRGERLPIQAEGPVDLAVDLGGASVTCLLEGTTGPQCAAGALVLAERKPGRALGPKDRRDLFRAWFDQVLLAAAGVQEGPRPVLLARWSPEGAGTCTATLPPMHRDPARELLAGWIREALASPRWTLMPLEAVLELDPEGAVGPAAMAAWIEAELDGEHPGFSSMHGPLPRAVEAPAEPAWRDLARARMGTFLDWVAAWEAEP